MDTENHFFFCILAVHPSQRSDDALLLKGFDFHGGLSLQATPWHCVDEGNVFLVSKDGTSQIKGEIDSIHRPGRGIELELRNANIESLPCLLTTHPEMRWAFVEAVGVTSDDVEFEVESSIEELGVPLVGDRWLGVVERENGENQLTAFTLADAEIGNVLEGFCPWWSEGMQDEDGVTFTISR